MCTLCGQRGPSPYSLSQKRVPIFCTCYTKNLLLKSRWFFYLSGNLFLLGNNFHLVNCLKSFYFKFFFVYTSLGGPFSTFEHNFCFILESIWLASERIKCSCRVVHQVTKQRRNYSKCDTLKEGPHYILGKEGLVATASLLPKCLPLLLNIHKGRNWLPSMTLLSSLKFCVTWWNIFFDCSDTSCSA